MTLSSAQWQRQTNDHEPKLGDTGVQRQVDMEVGCDPALRQRSMTTTLAGDGQGGLLPGGDIGSGD